MSEEYPDDCLKREKRLSLKKTLHCETMREGEEREREKVEQVSKKDIFFCRNRNLLLIGAFSFCKRTSFIMFFSFGKFVKMIS